MLEYTNGESPVFKAGRGKNSGRKESPTALTHPYLLRPVTTVCGSSLLISSGFGTISGLKPPGAAPP